MTQSDLRKYTDYELILEFFRVRRYDPDTSTMVDVGAQIGLWSRAYVRIGWQVIAFEPEQGNFDKLIANIDNAKGNFDARRLAIADAIETDRRFYFNSERNGINSLEVNHKELNEHSFQLVTVSTLDQELTPEPSERELRLVKLDIEGAELKALRGFDLQRFNPEIMICEFGLRSKSFGSTYRDLAEYGLAQGYQCIVSHKQNLENTVLWLGDYDSDYSRKMSENAWGELIFVRPDVRVPFLQCLNVFHLDFDVGLA